MLEILIAKGSQSVKLIPALTSATDQGYSATSTTPGSPQEGPLCAFDGNLNTRWAAKSVAGGASACWLKIALPTDKVALKLVLTNAASNSFSPRIFRLLGSNDDQNYVVLLDAQNAITTPGAILTFNITKPGSYKFYKLDIQSTNSNTSWATVGEMNLLGQK